MAAVESGLDYTAGNSSFKQAVEKVPSLVPVRTNAGRILTESGQVDENWSRKSPGYSIGYYNLQETIPNSPIYTAPQGRTRCHNKLTVQVLTARLEPH